MRVEEVYRPGALTCEATDSLAEVARAMSEHRVGSLAVLDGNVIVGIISERDVTRAVAQGADPRRAASTDFAAHDVQTAEFSEDTLDVARRMLDAGIRHLPVLRGRTVTGMVSMRDLLAVEAWA